MTDSYFLQNLFCYCYVTKFHRKFHIGVATKRVFISCHTRLRQRAENLRLTNEGGGILVLPRLETSVR